MNSMVPDPVRIAAVQRETPDTFTLTVEPRGRAEFKPFQPGQFSMLYAFGNAELPISISSDPAVSTELRYTIRAVGAATTCLVNSKADDWIGMRGPFGAGWPVERAVGRDVVLAAGGIGLAPLRPVVYTILRRRDS